MRAYSYRAVDGGNSISSGAIEARDVEHARRAIEALGLILIDIRARPKWRAFLSRSERLRPTRSQVADFTRSLATLLRAGVNILDAVKTLIADTPNRAMLEFARDLEKTLERGASFHSALARWPGIFPERVGQMIRAGEISGELDSALERVAFHYERFEELIDDFKMALIYPVSILLALGALVALLLTFAMPRFKTILDELDAPTPFLMAAALSVGDFLATFWVVILLGALGLATLIYFLARFHPPFIFFIESIVWRAPIVGRLFALFALARFSHTCSTLIESGIPILESIALCRSVTGSALFERALIDCEEAIRAGSPIADSLERSALLSPFAMRMIRVGERSGDLGRALERLARNCDDEIPRAIKKIFGALEPIGLLALVGIVGLAAFAVFSPILGVMGAILR